MRTARWAVMMLAGCTIAACGGSGSETPPPIEPMFPRANLLATPDEAMSAPPMSSAVPPEDLEEPQETEPAPPPPPQRRGRHRGR